MAKLFNRAKMTTSTTGSGTVTLSAAANGFQSFADAGVSDGDVIQYVIEEGNAWEIGTGAYSATGTSLTRTPSESSDGGSAITLGGTANVSITAVASQIGGGDRNLSFDDNAKAIFGAGSDLEIYHDGSNSYVWDAGTGNLILVSDGSGIEFKKNNGEYLASFSNDGPVNLYYDNAAKLATTSTGVDITGTLTADGVEVDDNAYIKVGTGDDLWIYHNGSNSLIEDRGTGDLVLKANNDFWVQDYGTNETMLRASSNAGVTLYYDNATKLATTSTGITVTGTAVATTDTDTTNSGSVTLDFGANQNFVLTLTGNVTLANPTTEQVGQSGFIVFIQDGTGGRTVSLGTDYETAGGAGLTLSSAASTTDVVPYIVAASGRILLGAPQLAFA